MLRHWAGMKNLSKYSIMIMCSQMGYSKPVSYQPNDATSLPTAKEFRALSMVYAAALGMHSEIFKTFFKASIFFSNLLL